MVVHALSHNSLRLLLLCLLCCSATGAEESRFTVNVEGLRMREGPSIESGVRKSLAKGTILVQISEEEHAANIDGYRSYWIEVRDDTGSRGWVYRAYLIRIGVYSHDSVTNECVAGDCVNGRGVLVWSDGFTYEGAFRNGAYDGQGVLRLGDRRIPLFAVAVLQIVIMVANRGRAKEDLGDFGSMVGAWVAKAARYQSAASDQKPWPWTPMGS